MQFTPGQDPRVVHAETLYPWNWSQDSKSAGAAGIGSTGCDSLAFQPSGPHHGHRGADAVDEASGSRRGCQDLHHCARQTVHSSRAGQLYSMGVMSVHSFLQQVCLNLLRVLVKDHRASGVVSTDISTRLRCRYALSQAYISMPNRWHRQFSNASAGARCILQPGHQASWVIPLPPPLNDAESKGGSMSSLAQQCPRSEAQATKGGKPMLTPDMPPGLLGKIWAGSAVRHQQAGTVQDRDFARSSGTLSHSGNPRRPARALCSRSGKRAPTHAFLGFRPTAAPRSPHGITGMGPLTT